MTKRLIIAAAFFIISFNKVSAQELPIFQQYLQNFYYLNPAAIGIKPCFETIFTDRHQWTGIQGAPNTQGLGIYNRFNLFKNKDLGYEGLGLTLSNDNNGPSNSKRVQLGFSHHITLHKYNRRKSLKMALGAAVSYFQFQLNESELFALEENDPLVTGGVLSSSFFNFDVGAILYTDKLTLGITAAQLLNQEIAYFGAQNFQTTHYFLFASYKQLNVRGNGIAPSVVFKNTERQQQLDLNLKMYFNDIFSATASYRRNFDDLIGSNISAMALIGVDLGNYKFGYAYEISLSRIGRYNYGTHDIMLAYKFCKESKPACPAYW